MKRFLLIGGVLVLSTPLVFGQRTAATDSIYQTVEKPATFPGGNQALSMYLMQNLNYPREAAQQGIQGRVYVEFVVEKDGRLTQIKTMNQLKGGLVEEGIRIVRAMPRWSPAEQNGQPVRSKQMLPITFKTEMAREPTDSKSSELPELDQRAKIVAAYQRENKEPIYEWKNRKADVWPEFPGGSTALSQFIETNLRRPADEKRTGEQLSSTIGFVVMPDGSLQFARSMGRLGKEYDEALLELIKQMPAWTPGKKDGKPVACLHLINVTFP